MRKIDRNTHPPKGTRSGKQLFFPYPSVFAKSYVRCVPSDPTCVHDAELGKFDIKRYEPDIKLIIVIHRHRSHL